METRSGARAGHRTIVERTREVLAGMQNVERDIIEQLRPHRLRPRFEWNHNRSLAELPESIHLEVRAGAKNVSADLPRIHLEDSNDRIDRWEVRMQIERIVEELAPPAPGV